MSPTWKERILAVKAADGGKRQNTRASTFQSYLNWCQEDGKVTPLPVSYWSIGGFLVFYVSNNKGSCRSIKNKLSLIRTSCTLCSYGWLSERDQFQLKELIKNLKYHDKSKSRVKEAMTIGIIQQIIRLKNLSDAFHLLVVILYLLAHHGLLRGAEITSGFLVEDIVWDYDYRGFKLMLERTKTHRTGEAISVHYRDNESPLSVVKLLTKWFDMNNLWLNGKHIVFPSITMVKGKGPKLDWNKPLSYNQLRMLIKMDIKSIGLNPDKFSCHSLRAGGATDLFNSRKLSLAQIMIMGRWKSVEAAMRYFRDELNIAQSVSDIFGDIFGSRWV